MNPIIVGAGLTGLVAAHAWPRAVILEKESGPRQMHKALLRFRGEAVSTLTGIEFKKVTVRKALWSDGNFQVPTLRHANSYSFKVLGRIENDRSVWNLDPVERWIAPENFYERLVEAVGHRINWGATPDWVQDAATYKVRPMISTIPLPAVIEELGARDWIEGLTFGFSSITVRRYRVADCNVFQTIYFPDRGTGLYRASITGDLLIAESIAPADPEQREQRTLEEAFGVEFRLTPIDTVSQKYGKVAPIDPVARRALLLKLTTERGIYSLGRFATWRNVLMDDVVQDIAVVRKLMDGDHYTSRIAAAS